MINIENFLSELNKRKVSLFTGVPDSLLKDFCSYLQDNIPKEKNIIAANEGNAVAIAAGHFLATGYPALVYMQNSGLGNAVNPLVSLADSEVYGIPILLLIGWRGEPNVKDEPQHKKQGKITTKLLEVLEIPFDIVSCETQNISEIVEKACKYMKKKQTSYAILARKGSFEEYKGEILPQNNYELSREQAIEIILNSMSENDAIVSTTGKASRELFEIRERNHQSHEKDFLTVGSMGHSSSIALGGALASTKRIFCIDGDGALIMHMGALGIIGDAKPENFFHKALYGCQ